MRLFDDGGMSANAGLAEADEALRSLDDDEKRAVYERCELLHNLTTQMDELVENRNAAFKQEIDVVLRTIADIASESKGSDKRRTAMQWLVEGQVDMARVSRISVGEDEEPTTNTEEERNTFDSEETRESVAAQEEEDIWDEPNKGGLEEEEEVEPVINDVDGSPEPMPVIRRRSSS
jgi:hypothetical protein